MSPTRASGRQEAMSATARGNRSRKRNCEPYAPTEAQRSSSAASRTKENA